MAPDIRVRSSRRCLPAGSKALQPRRRRHSNSRRHIWSGRSVRRYPPRGRKEKEVQSHPPPPPPPPTVCPTTARKCCLTSPHQEQARCMSRPTRNRIDTGTFAEEAEASAERAMHGAQAERQRVQRQQRTPAVATAWPGRAACRACRQTAVAARRCVFLPASDTGTGRQGLPAVARRLAHAGARQAQSACKMSAC